MLAVCDIRHLQKLNNWAPREVSGIAVELNDMKRILEVEAELDDTLPMNQDDDFYKITTLRETAPQVFDWLNLLNMNVWIILTLIVVVAGFNMVSGLLILILDKTSFIGILKALGYRNIRLRRLFLYIAAGLIGKGMVVGNILALTLGGLQALFRIVRLDSATYYMDTVPIYFDWVYIILLNVGVLVVSVLMLVVPTMLISRIKPIKAIRFE
ncbi:MAG: ABC transporter permease [Odoribacter splanchnicus]